MKSIKQRIILILKSKKVKISETISEKLSKSIASLDYMNKVLIVLSTTSSGVSIISHTSVIGIPAGIISSSFTLVFCLTTGIIKKIIKKK